MKKMKLFALALSALLCLTMLAGCGAKPAESQAGTDGKKVITVATHAEFPPYEFYENEKIVGIDIEIMQAICDKLGYDMEVVDMAFGSIITAVASGKADVGAAGISKTEDRLKSVNFTEDYATGIQSIIVKEGSPIAGPDDLDGKMIGVQQDTTGDIYGTGKFGDEHMVRYNKGADAVQALITGKCDAVIIDNGPAKVFEAQNEELVVLDTPFEEEQYSFEISYDQPELYEEINGTLKALLEDGTVQTIIDKYISAE